MGKFLAMMTMLLLVSLSFSYQINKTREEMLNYYYANIEQKIPKSAKVLIGNERINAYFGNEIFGIETRNGNLYYFERYPLEGPGIVVTVSDYAAEQIGKRKMGIAEAIGNGGIRIEAKNLLSSLKVEAAKRIYAISGGDDYVLGKKATPEERVGTYSSIYVSRTRIWN
ncbi:MAG: hypothetical protein WC588_05130 [Candidatus Micrarchaeia archaeon]